MLFRSLREGELCVCDFVEVLAVTQSKASRHLRYLVNAGLIQDRRAAIWVYFRIVEHPGLVEGAVLADLRQRLPAQLPAHVLAELASWRKRKAKGGVACAPPALVARKARA